MRSVHHPQFGIRLPGMQNIGGGGAAAFSPSDVAGLVAWYDFSDATKLYTDSGKTTPVSSDGDFIGACEDKSGTGNDAVQAGVDSTKPTYQTGVQNSLSIGRFDGLAEFLNISDVLVSGSTNRTVFIVGLPTAAGNTSYLCLGDSASTGQIFQITPEIAVRVNSGNRIFDAASSTVSFQYLTIALDGTDCAGISAWVNGAALGISSTNNQTLNTTGDADLGAARGGSRFPGDIGEIIVYTGALSTANRQAVEAYLASKWNI